MTPLREQLLTDMRAQNLPQKLQERYVAEIAALAKETRKSPDLIAQDELAEFLEKRRKDLPEKEATLAVDAIRFFYTQTLGRCRKEVHQHLRSRGSRPESDPPWRWPTFCAATFWIILIF